MIGLARPYWDWNPVSYVCHQEAAVIRHVIRVKREEKKKEEEEKGLREKLLSLRMDRQGEGEEG